MDWILEKMTVESNFSTARNIANKVLRGRDGKIRALWRVLLGVPVYFVLFILILSLLPQVDIQPPILSATAPPIIHALLFTAIFVFVWSRHLDATQLSSYGIPGIGGFLKQITTGFLLTFLGFGVWYGVLVASGWMQFRIVLEYPEGSFAVAAVVASVSVLLGAWTQDVLYLGIIFRNSAEGLTSRLDDSTGVIVGAFLVTAAIFLGYHFILGIGATTFLPPLEAAIFLLVGIAFLLAVFIRTESLPMAAGAHGAINLVPGFIFARAPIRDAPSFAVPRLFAVDGTSPLPELVSTAPVVEVTLAYLILLGLESAGVTLSTTNAIDSTVNAAD